jgi:hypothetical protein
MAAECRAIVEPVRDELTPLNDVLDAETSPEPDLDHEKRLKDLMRWEKDVRPQMAAKEQKKSQESPEAALERVQAEASTTVVIGDDLSKILGSMKKGQAA